MLSLSESPIEKTLLPAPSPVSRSSAGRGASPLTAKWSLFGWGEVYPFGGEDSK